VHAYDGPHSACYEDDNCGPLMRPEVVHFFQGFGAPLFADDFESALLAAWSLSVA
jgi:hypothetical protein